jgi:hypothetical protein
MRSALVCAIGLVVVATIGACRGINSKSAVEKAIQAHLERNSTLALNAFTTEVSSVKFDGDNAEAVVTFRSTQAQDMSVQVRYTLRKEGDHWVVQSSAGMGDSPHGGGMPQSPGQGANPHEGHSIPTTPPPPSEPQPTPSH